MKIEMIKLFKMYGNNTMKSYFRSDDYSENYYNFTGLFLEISLSINSTTRYLTMKLKQFLFTVIASI